MKSKLLSIFFLLATASVLGQAPSIQWQKCYGGTLGDDGTWLEPTSDGGYVIAGATNSTDGDVSSNQGSNDYWVIKIDAVGIIQWQKTYGGSSIEAARCIKQTTDGGYIVAGTSNSNDGDVTGHHGATTSPDHWVIKLSASGVIQWEKSLGGSSVEDGTGVQQTSDGGYLVSGFTQSFDGDVTGIHSGAADYWIVKLTSNGTIQWQKVYGGSADDVGLSAQQTTDGGFVIVGSSYSNNGDVTGHHNSTSYIDYWVVKTDSMGTIQWQKSLGGSYDDEANVIQQTSDGGYIIAGQSVSNDGDVSGNHGLSRDTWIVKLDNSGVIMWQQSYGGTGTDIAFSIHEISTGGYVFAGSSDSNDGDVSGNHGVMDIWAAKISASGVLAWQKCMGGSASENCRRVKQTSDGGFILVGGTGSVDGDITFNHGQGEVWVIKLDPLNSVDEVNAKDAALIYPNPAQNELYIYASSEEWARSVCYLSNALGERILFDKVAYDQNRILLGLSHLPNGIYYLELRNSFKVITKKIIIEN